MLKHYPGPIFQLCNMIYGKPYYSVLICLMLLPIFQQHVSGQFTEKDFIVMAIADPGQVCLGEPVQLDVEVSGGSGSYAYTWTSDPEGFNSTLRNPLARPGQSTAYIVKASDGTNTGYDTVHVTVNPLPEVSLGKDTTVCQGSSVTFDAGPGYHSYLWQDGSEGQTIVATEQGYYRVEVSNEFGCYNSDTVWFGVMEVPPPPAKPAGPSFVDLSATAVTSYITSANPLSEGYIWELDPEGAGTVSNNDAEALVNWDTSYNGIAFLKVWSYNQCGSNSPSDSLLIQVVNTSSLHEMETKVTSCIFPNPSSGVITLSLHGTEKTSCTLSIFNSMGEEVHQFDKLVVQGNYTGVLHLNSLPSGFYTLVIRSPRYIIKHRVVMTE